MVIVCSGRMTSSTGASCFFSRFPVCDRYYSRRFFPIPSALRGLGDFAVSPNADSRMLIRIFPMSRRGLQVVRPCHRLICPRCGAIVPRFRKLALMKHPALPYVQFHSRLYLAFMAIPKSLCPECIVGVSLRVFRGFGFRDPLFGICSA